MNEVMAFPLITKRKANNSSPTRSGKHSTFRSSYLNHLYERRVSNSPVKEQYTNPSPTLIKRPKHLPPIVKLENTQLFQDPSIQEKYQEIQTLFK